MIPARPDSSHRRLLLCLALASLAFAWITMGWVSAGDRWYRNADMNIHNVGDALTLNAGMAPGLPEEPAAVTKYLLALDYRVRNALGGMPVWHVKRFARSQEPLSDLAQLVDVGRTHSRLLAMAFILVAALCAGHIARSWEVGCLAAILFSGSSGLLFHGLLTRPELLCVGFGGVLSIYCAWLAHHADRGALRGAWLWLSGAALGLGLLSKLPSWLHVATVLLWCLVASFGREGTEKGRRERFTASLWLVLPCLLSGWFLLLLLALIDAETTFADDVALGRIRLLAIGVIALPLLQYARASGRLTGYLTRRSAEVALVLAGVLGALVLWYGLLRLVLPGEPARDYFVRILTTIFHPEPLLQIYTGAGGAKLFREALQFFLETPVLYLVSLILAVTLVGVSGMATRLRLLVLLLVLQGLAFTAMLSLREFLDHFSIFVQVPLLLAWAIALGSLRQWWSDRGTREEQRWPVVLAAAASLLLVVTTPLTLHRKFHSYREDATLPVQDLTVVLLYDHEVHAPAYLEAMKKHFPTRERFREELDRFLASPANRP